MRTGRLTRRVPAVGVVGVVLALVGCSSLGPGASASHSVVAPKQQSVRAATAAVGSLGTDWVRRENARPGTTAWKVARSAVAGDLELAGYADHVSVTAGQPFGLFVTARAGSFVVRAFRLGWYGGAQGRLVWTSARLPGHRQAPAQLAAGRMVTTAWTPSTTVTTAGWLPGSYLLLLTDSSGRKKYVPLTVRSPDVAARLVLVNAVTTYQAYNQWGGYSLYHGANGSFGTRSSRVSFDRPYDGNGARVLSNYEQPTIAQAERLGLPLAYVTSTDVDAGTYRLSLARGVVSLGHDEYWTTGMRAAVTAARDAGTNLAFLGANAVYWRVRLADSTLGSRRVVVAYKSTADPVRGATTTVKWRSSPNARGENSLVGMLYECFPASGSLVVDDPSFFLLRGTGAQRGARYAGVVGDEVDRAYPIGGTPANLQVVAHSRVSCGPSRSSHSDMTYYTTRSGAGVFAVGTMNWSKALHGSRADYAANQGAVAFVRIVTTNLLTSMARGPLGSTHPSVGDLAAVHSSPDTSTGTGGPVG